MTRRPLPLLLTGLAVAAAAAGAGSLPAAQAATTCPKPPPVTFSAPTYVDTNRAGGEPIVFTYPDGRLLYGAHAGTTHFFAPGAGDADTQAFAEEYKGQTYYWWSESDGGEWTFSDRTIPPDNVVASGFSDPEFAFDTAGNVYVSEINLVNVAVSKSTDGGKSYTVQNPTANVFTDRQWMEGDEENVLYMVSNPTGPGGSFDPGEPEYQVNSGHTMYKSVDGGKTWTPGFSDAGGLGDIRVDKSDGTVYEAHYSGNLLEIAAFRNARGNDFIQEVEPEKNTVFDDVHMIAHWPAFDLDPSGNLYMTWDENGTGELEAGIYFTSSKDKGRTWSKPLRVNTNENTAIWPWLGVGDDGKVGIAWLETDRVLPNHNAATAGTHPWRIVGGTTLTGLGCAGGKAPSFSIATMTPDPVHTGTICQGGTICQATLTDRRLGDYFSVDIDNKGMLYAGYSDTAKGGAVSLPGFVRQNGGTPLVGTVKVPPGKKNNPGTGTQQPPPRGGGGTAPGGRDPIASTGMDAAVPVAAGTLAMAALAVVRRRRREA